MVAAGLAEDPATRGQYTRRASLLDFDAGETEWPNQRQCNLRRRLSIMELLLF